MGNICRSPTAEGVFAHYVEKRGLAEAFRIDSAGTIGYHTGELPDRRTRQAASQRGYSLTSRARQVTPADLDTFDLVLAMDQVNLRDIQRLAGGNPTRAEVRLFCDFLPKGDSRRDVPDPYYGGPEGFEEVLDMAEAACPALLAHARSKASGAA